jgi:acyl-CoA synthetase (AMP-forming)/AMP-acid ligase II
VPPLHLGVLERAGAHGGLIARRRLRFIRSCSSALPPVLMAELERAFDAPVIEAYGMTEASHQMASNPLPPRARKPGSVGVAAGPEVAIMDESGKLLPPGATGEIVIRGRNVTAGYESNPDANQKAFTNGWFRTGDQGCMDADGYVFLTGRLKELINRGGEKIAPREVDEALLAHPAVAQAVAFALPHATLGETVAAAVVLRTGASAGEEDLRTFAAGRLAEFKVPGRVLILDAIPKGPTGKPQRIGLADKLAAHLKTAFAEPRTETERFLAETWRSALNGARAGLYDNFFDLGGNSLLAAQVVARVRKKLGVRLELRDLSLQTLGQLAALCEQRRQERTPARGGLRAKLLKKLTRSSP